MTPGPVLRDIHLPAEPGWWPPAPGWWALGALLLLVLVVLGWKWSRLLRRRRLLRALDALVTSAQSRHAAEDGGAALAAELSALLRRAARLHGPAAAGLQGQAWLCWLDGDDPAAPFSAGPGRLLLDAPFRRALPRTEVLPLVPLVRRRLLTLAGAVHG